MHTRRNRKCGARERIGRLFNPREGSYYIRTTPTSDFGTDGRTEVYRVGANGDELIDKYAVYMRGRLYLGWSPIAGKWCVVQVEPERITSDIDQLTFGAVSRLLFFMGGEQLIAYSRADLEAMGLRKQSSLASGDLGNFVVRGIEQTSADNQYAFVIEKVAHKGIQTMSFDITTGKAFKANSGAK